MKPIALVSIALFACSCGKETIVVDAGEEDVGREEPACGNGMVEPGEECDDGENNSDTRADACRTDCTLPRCGDGVVDGGEECEPGDTVSCTTACGTTGSGPCDPERCRSPGPDACAPPPESCYNALDDDCDGTVDFSSVEPETMITEEDGYGAAPHLVDASSAVDYFSVVWHDTRDGNYEIYYALIDGDEGRVRRSARVTEDGGASQYPVTAYTSSSFGTAWQDDRDGNYEIRFRLLDFYGEPLGDDMRITHAEDESVYPSLAWTGSRFGLAWQDRRDGSSDIYFALLEETGEAAVPAVEVTSTGRYSGSPSIAWSGSVFGIGYEDSRSGSREIYFSVLDADGAKIGSDTRITRAEVMAAQAAVVWNGSRFGAAWQDYRDGNYEIYVALLEEDGEMSGEEIRITEAENDSTNPSLSWTGSYFAVAWSDSRDWPVQSPRTYFVMLDEHGGKVGNESEAAVSSLQPSLAWTGSHYALAYAGGNGIFFTRLRCD
jgi:hypothetical protein